MSNPLVLEKDIFEAFYKRHLSRRLLLGRSISNDMEKMVLLKLKAGREKDPWMISFLRSKQFQIECGPNFTKNLEAMFTDIEVSADLHAQFKVSIGAEEANKLLPCGINDIHVERRWISR